MAILDAAPYAVGSLAVNSLLQRQTAERNQQYYRENMHANYLISQQAQRNAARNEVEGLRSAGLNPALADGAAGAPQVSAQGGTEQAAQFDPANLLLRGQLKLQEAQVQNVKADTGVKRTEAAVKSQELGEKQTAGMTASLNLSNHFLSLAENTSDPSLKAFYESMAEEAEQAGRFGVGAQESLRNFQQLRAESFESAERIIKSRLSATIAEAQFNKASAHGAFYKKLVNLPAQEYDKLVNETAKLAAERKNLEALQALATQQTELTKEQKSQVEAMTKRLQDYNIPQLIKSGDSSGSVAAFFGLLLEAIAGLPGKFSASTSTTTINK